MLPEINHILYATDLSDNARHAFGYAAAISEKFNAAISILYVVEDLSATGRSLMIDMMGEDEWQKIQQRRKSEYQKLIRGRLDEFCQAASEALDQCQYIITEYLIEDGNPAQRILYHAHLGKYDMVVMGSHGRGIFSGALLGNTARRVVRRSRIPVTVVRLPEE